MLRAWRLSPVDGRGIVEQHHIADELLIKLAHADFGSDLLAGISIVVSALLGHRSIDTTAIYVKVAVPQLAEVALPFPGSVR